MKYFWKAEFCRLNLCVEKIHQWISSRFSHITFRSPSFLYTFLAFFFRRTDAISLYHKNDAPWMIGKRRITMNNISVSHYCTAIWFKDSLMNPVTILRLTLVKLTAFVQNLYFDPIQTETCWCRSRNSNTIRWRNHDCCTDNFHFVRGDAQEGKRK